MNKYLVFLLSAIAPLTVFSAHVTEYLDRGVVALPADDGIFVSWRALKRDGNDAAYHIYRNGTKINTSPIVSCTNFTDTAGVAGAVYEIRTVVGDSIIDCAQCTAWNTPYLKIHLDRPAGGTLPGRNGAPAEYTYSPNDMSVGDVDGDGAYELFVKWEPSNARDSAHPGLTGSTVIDCYKLDGERLWRVDLGHNIRAGAHYTQFVVQDFDGDGCAEMICKTAPGTRDGNGNWVLLGNDRPDDDYRVYEPVKAYGHVRGGGEYLTVFSGKTGEALHTIPYCPAYYDVPEEIWGDEKCNRADRYLAGAAFLDGHLPSAIMCRGYYCGAFVWAVDYRDGKLQEVWLHKSDKPFQGLWGEGAHSVVTGDVDGDGRDEIIFGASALDHDGSLLYRTGGGHGDALHLGKFLPERPGLQVYMPHEEEYAPYPYDTSLRDAATGEIIYMKPQSGTDVGRGLIADITDAYPGHEYWASDSRTIYNHGKPVGKLGMPINFRIYWDGDLLDELLDGTRIYKPDSALTHLATLMDFRKIGPVRACNWTKNTPCLQADILGDWREEVILRDAVTNSDIYIFTTSIPTVHKLPCLMEDRQYRLAIASQNTCYNQPPHLSYSPSE